jgi:glycosyltransferase involved in cell wall biosynthesis
MSDSFEYVPLISVVLPTLNCKDNLVAALHSLITQSSQRFEVILSDGGSTDGTLDFARNLLTHFNLSYCIVEKTGSSIYGAMNLGIGVAMGDWLYFMGSDDLLFGADVFERISPSLCDHMNQVVYGDVWIQSSHRLWGYGSYNSRALGRWNIPHQATFYRRQTIEHHGLKFDEQYPVEADWDFNLRLWKHVKFKYVDLVVARYAGDGASAQSSSFPLYEKLAERLLQIYGLSAFSFLPSYRLADACLSHPNPLFRWSFRTVRIYEALVRVLRKLISRLSISSS